jgi:hypothetical protein
MRSFERRLGASTKQSSWCVPGRGDELERRQRRISETRTADEDADEASERHEEFEEAALGGVVAVTLMDLQGERAVIEGLLGQARRLAEAGEDSKFEKLRTVLRDPAFAREKFIVAGARGSRWCHRA